MEDGFLKILQVNKLTKRFGELAAVKDLSFEVERGEIFGIAGPNGAGKTTLFNLISGVYSGSGDIIFEGKNLHGFEPFQVCHNGVARTFQVPTLFSTVSIYQNIKVGAHFGALKDKNEKERIDRVIDFVGLRGRENAIVASVDLFHKKLTMLGAALATQPKLLLLDEPIGGLSPREIKYSVALFQKINTELGITIIIIEHLMKVLVEVSHRLMIINNGEKICIGSPEEVIQDRTVIEVYLVSCNRSSLTKI
jgi:branched-chain amino acid transport system ATP-binding protein